MARKSNKATYKLETSLSEFCLVVQGANIGTANKRKARKQAPKSAQKRVLEPKAGVSTHAGHFLARGAEFPKVANL